MKHALLLGIGLEFSNLDVRISSWTGAHCFLDSSTTLD